MAPELLSRIAFIVREIQISLCGTSDPSMAVTLYFMNGKLPIAGMYQSELLCFPRLMSCTRRGDDGHCRCQWTPGALLQPTIQMGMSVKSWGNVINHPRVPAEELLAFV